jgi:integrase
LANLTKRFVDAIETPARDAFHWDDELPGFGLRAFKSGKRSYLVQYRAAGRTRRYTIGLHGVWTPETARREAKILLGRIAHGENPSEEKRLDAKSITLKELCDRYLEDADNGLILGKGRRPKKASTIDIDRSRIRRHIIPLLGARRVKELASTDIVKFIRDVTSGKTKLNIKTKARGRAIVRGGAGTAARAVGLLGGILSYARENGVIEKNAVHGVRKPADAVRKRRLSEQEYRVLGEILAKAEADEQLHEAVCICRLIALSGCRRGEIIFLKWPECDTDGSCLRLADSKEGASIRPIGLSVVNLLEDLRVSDSDGYVIAGSVDGGALVGFPKILKRMLKETPLAGVTAHVLRHSFASLADDLGFTEATVAALIGHSRGTTTSKYIHSVDTSLIMAADAVAGHIDGLLKNVEMTRKVYSLDRAARQAAIARLYAEAENDRVPERRPT